MRSARSVLGVAVALALVASTASASLVIEIRQVGATEPGGGIMVTPGLTVNLEMWAVIIDDTTGNKATSGGVTGVISGAASSNGGFILGDIELLCSPTTFQQHAASYDQDGDGDLDGGDPTMGGGLGWLFFSPFFSNNQVETKIGTLTFTAGAAFAPGFEAGPSGIVWIDPVGTGLDSNYADPGNSNAFLPALPDGGVFLYAQSTAKGPDDTGGPIQVGDDPVILDASASTGSINWWGWYLRPGADPLTELPDFETTDGLLPVTLADLEGFGYVMSDIVNAVVKVGWVASDPINTSIAPFQLELVPEPATLALLGLGALALVRRKR